MLNLLSLCLLLTVVGCSLNQEPQVIVVTATMSTDVLEPPFSSVAATNSVNAEVSDNPLVASVPIREESAANTGFATQHIVRPGDTLGAIAQRYNTTVERLLELNQLSDANIIEVEQVIELPPAPDQVTPGNRLLSNALLVRNAHGSPFDTAAFIAAQPGFIRLAVDEVGTNRANGFSDNETLNAAEVVDRVSREFSVDARLLLVLLEYRAGWLTNPQPTEALRTFPMISEEAAGAFDRAGLYRQLVWTANELNRGYYGRKYNDWQILEFPDGERLLYAEALNAASVALQYFLHLNQPYSNWQRDVTSEGFTSTYARYFGEPAADLPDPLAGMGAQPVLTLPFAQGQTWYFTGGPHGGWGSGSAWASIDFAPPDDRQGGDAPCYTSEYLVTAVAAGVIARSEGGAAVLDLDGDGNELTGWSILYLHLAAQDRVSAGTRVIVGDLIGRASCEGGSSTATHMHIGRRYNGEWLPSSCEGCTVSSFVMSNWTVVGLPGQEYQGFLVRNGERRQAEQGRLNPINRVSW